MYNETLIENGTNIIDWLTAINSWTNGLFIVLLIVELFVITLIASKRYDTKVAFLVSSSVTMISSILLAYVHLIEWEIIAIPIVLWIGAIIMKIWGEEN